jgi:hypothetical protein
MTFSWVAAISKVTARGPPAPARAVKVLYHIF